MPHRNSRSNVDGGHKQKIRKSAFGSVSRSLVFVLGLFVRLARFVWRFPNAARLLRGACRPHRQFDRRHGTLRGVRHHKRAGAQGNLSADVFARHASPESVTAAADAKIKNFMIVLPGSDHNTPGMRTQSMTSALSSIERDLTCGLQASNLFGEGASRQRQKRRDDFMRALSPFQNVNAPMPALCPPAPFRLEFIRSRAHICGRRNKQNGKDRDECHSCR